ncbi:hypothetical protein B484DRAFT_399799 [Ochromonadaceae sp. CCMP2298]|nr:hypothetical protein B484DRAFT_399799 [Ochromonadaceae sp. CCMP2298]
MRATGIPPHLAITEKLKILIHDCAKMFTDTQTMRAEIFDRLPRLVAVAVGDELRTNFQVDGVAPLSLNDMNRRFDQMQGIITGLKLAIRHLLKKIWDLWFYGNMVTTVRPYSHIPERDLGVPSGEAPAGSL